MEQLFGKAIPSVINDPFNAKSIECVKMRAERAWFTKDRPFRFSGSVEFTNGDTDATQNFKANSLAELYTKMAEFCASLE